MRRTKTIALALILIGFIALGINSATSQTQKLQHKEIELKSTSAQLKQLNLDYEHLNLKLDKVDKTNSKEIKRLKEEKQRLEKEKARLERELVSKRNEENGLNTASTRLANALGGTRTASAQGNGSCESWIAQAGITELASARELISRESGCNPNAVNPSSGACGVAQELPCGKSGCSLGDGACQVKWMDRYVKGRYGSWASAVSFHNANNYY